MTKMFTAGFLALAAVLGISAVSAQQATPAPSERPGQGMTGQGMMQGGGGMMPMMQMMDSCNRMMQSMMGRQDAPRPGGQPQPAPQSPQGNRG